MADAARTPRIAILGAGPIGLEAAVLAHRCGFDEFHADVICGTHTGLHWERRFESGRRMIKIGVLGRPENDGTPRVWYTLLSTNDSESGIDVEFVPVEYDHERLTHEMWAEKLTEEFVQTILTGRWTTCLEILPSKERRRGRC